MDTQRLKLEPLLKEDLEIFYQINIHPFVRKYLWDDEIISKKLAEEILEESEGKHQTEKWGLWKIMLTENKVCIGYTGLWYFFEEPYPQLLYALLPEYTGKGYAGEAAQKIVDYAFAELQFDHISAATDGPNTKSIGVCEKLGFERLEEKIIDGKPTLFYRKLAS